MGYHFLQIGIPPHTLSQLAALHTHIRVLDAAGACRMANHLLFALTVALAPADPNVDVPALQGVVQEGAPFVVTHAMAHQNSLACMYVSTPPNMLPPDEAGAGSPS
jgi:hypothetical protein